MESGRSEQSDKTERSVSSSKSNVTTRSNAQSSRSSTYSKDYLLDKQSEKLSVVHQNILDVLSSSKILQPIHVDIRNESYWYNMRRKLGPKKHAALMVKQNANNLQWESSIFKMKLRDEDMEVVPKKVLTGSFKTKWQAFKGAEAATKERDENPARIKRMADIIKTERIASTHFKILVVSEKFHHMNYLERISLVYQELLRSSMGCNVLPTNCVSSIIMDNKHCNTPAKSGLALGRCAPTRMKISSTYGTNVCSLELFRFIAITCSDHGINNSSSNGKGTLNTTNGFNATTVVNSTSHKQISSFSGDGLHLLIDARTPSQWRSDIYTAPLSERLGTAHVQLRSGQIIDAAKPRGHKNRIKKLTTTTSNTPDKKRMQHLQQPMLLLHGHHQNRRHSRLSDDDGDTSLGDNSSMQDDEEVDQFADSIGLDATVSGVQYRKLGGIYGHFFNDLSPSIKELVLSKYKDNKQLIRYESNLDIIALNQQRKKEHSLEVSSSESVVVAGIAAASSSPLLATSASGSSQKQQQQQQHVPKTNIARMRARAEAALISGEKDKGTLSEVEMMEEVNISNLKMERAAVRLQRVRRLYMWNKAIKHFWWRLYSAISIQRVLRGHFGRQYVLLFKSLRPRASIRIQRCFRFSRSRVLLHTWQELTYRLTRKILPKIKRFIRNCYLWWMYRRELYVIRIQSIVRGYLGRVRYYLHAGYYYYDCYLFPSAALVIQRVIRGFLGRRAVQRRMIIVLIQHIDIPAAVRIQRIYRGRLAKFVLYRKRREYRSLLKLQRFIRKFVQRMWFLQVHKEQVRKNAAIDIQRVHRGNLDRQIAALKRHVRWYNELYIPSIIKVQAAVRRHRAMNYLANMIDKGVAAIIVQRYFRNYQSRKLAVLIRKEMKSLQQCEAATVIQRYVRRLLAMKLYRRKYIEYQGKVIVAAKIIMRAWSNFVTGRKYRVLLDNHRRRSWSSRIVKLIDAREDVAEDVREVKIDISTSQKVIDRFKARIKLIEQFSVQASLRSSKVRAEMETLGIEDFEGGSLQ